MTRMAKEYVFVCVNEKRKGKCCGTEHTHRIYEQLRRTANQLNRENPSRAPIKVVKTGCLGQCAYGPNAYLPSRQRWFTLSTPEQAEACLTFTQEPEELEHV